MRLSRALRLPFLFPLSLQRRGAKGESPAIALVGAGGKTTALFLLARQLLAPPANSQGPSAGSQEPIANSQQPPANTQHATRNTPDHWSLNTDHCILLTATSHLSLSQTSLTDHHLIASSPDQLSDNLSPGITLVTGPLEGDRMAPVNPAVLSWLRDACQKRGISLLIEADGSRGLPLKAPADHEPPIPDFVDTVIVIAGLSGLAQPLDESHIHRPQIFSALSGLPLGAPVTPDALARVLTHPQGGLKNIPSRARRVALLNQADTPELQAIGGKVARDILPHFDSVLVGSLHQDNFQTFERVALIILAAGESTRFGQPKQLLDWNGTPFVRRVAQTALQADLGPVAVVVGHRAPDVESALAGLPVTIVHNPDYRQGQSASIRAGLTAFPSPTFGENEGGREAVGSAIFLLADQPQIPVEVIRALAETHAQSLPAILAPLVLEEKRANPVLFDRAAFPDLLALTGDVGGRAIFDKHQVAYLPWHDDLLLFDVDNPEDYARLIGADSNAS